MSEPGLVVVTGAGGFIGRALVAHFTRTGRPFRAIVRRHSGPSPGMPPPIVVADLATMSEGEAESLVRDAAAIVHLAGRAYVLDDTAPDPASAYASPNVTATVRVARAAVREGLGRFVLASTVKVNGEVSQPSRPFVPSDVPDPRDDYARSKLDAERELFTLCAGTPMVPIVLRLPLVYGPGVKGNFAALLDAIARRRPLPLGAIRNRRSLLYVGNLVEAIDAVLDAREAPAGVHFVADRESVSVPALVTAAAAALGTPVRLPRIPVRLLEFAGEVSGRRALIERLVGTLEVDWTSLRAATGWQPRHSLADGLGATASWWRMRHSM